MGLISALQFMMTGTKHFTKKGYLKAATRFDNSAMERRLDGKVCMVTGANTGLGYKTCEELAKRGCTLYMVCRNPERGEEAVKKVREATGNTNVHLKVCDVSNLQSIASMTKEYEESGQPLHVLVNNAGAIFYEKEKSPEGYDLAFATNTLGHFALTHWLTPVLIKSAPAKVIMISSGGMLREKMFVNDLHHDKMKPYDGIRAYSIDKRRQVALAEKFSSLLHDKGVDVYSMHPGWSGTEGVQKFLPSFYNYFKDNLRDLNEGSDTIVWLALQEQNKLVPGEFYFDRAIQPKNLSMCGTSYTQHDVDELYEQCKAMTEKVTKA